MYQIQQTTLYRWTIVLQYNNGIPIKIATHANKLAAEKHAAFLNAKAAAQAKAERAKRKYRNRKRLET